MSFRKVLLCLRLSHLIWQQCSLSIPQSSLSHLLSRYATLAHVSSLCHCVVDKTGKKSDGIVEEGFLPPSWGQFPYLVQGAAQPGTWLEGLKSITQGGARWDSVSQNYCQRCMPCMSALPERWSQQGE